MNAFELDRLRREGKCVQSLGNRCALDIALEQELDEADKRIDEFYQRKSGELTELEDSHGLDMTRLLGC